MNRRVLRTPSPSETHSTTRVAPSTAPAPGRPPRRGTRSPEFEVTPGRFTFPRVESRAVRTVVERGARERASNHAIAVHHLVGGEPNRHRHRLARGTTPSAGFNANGPGARDPGSARTRRPRQRKLRRAGVSELERVRSCLEHHRRANTIGLTSHSYRALSATAKREARTIWSLLVRLDRRLGHGSNTTVVLTDAADALDATDATDATDASAWTPPAFSSPSPGRSGSTTTVRLVVFVVPIDGVRGRLARRAPRPPPPGAASSTRRWVPTRRQSRAADSPRRFRARWV